MTKKFDRDAYLRTLSLVQQIKDEKERLYQERILNETIPEVKPSGWLTIKSLLVTALIVAIALIILVGSVVVIPTILVVLIGYLVFLAVRTSLIK